MSTHLFKGILVYDDALPTRWSRRLRTQVMTLEKQINGDCWYDLQTPPRTFFEQVIATLYRSLLGGQGFVGAEYWMRVQPAHDVFFLHFDRDESVRERYLCPTRSSVFYLSESGGPTVILPTTPIDESWSHRAAVVWPHLGRYMLFPGNLLHGVLPGSPARWPRVAFFINWWQAELTALKPNRYELSVASALVGQRARSSKQPRICHDMPEFMDTEMFLPAEIWDEFRTRRLQPGRSSK